jgi:hypothetical protein
MTTLALDTLRGAPVLLQRLGQSISNFLDGIGEARTMAETFKSLSRLTDDQLAERGLKRQDIPRLVLASVGK